MYNSEGITINLQFGGGTSTKIDGHTHVINCPLPFPYPFPFPWPFPMPNGGSFYGLDQSNTDESISNDLFGDLMYEGARVSLASRLGKEYNRDEMARHIKEDVRPKIEAAVTISDMNEAMTKVFKAFPNVQEFVLSVAEKHVGAGSTTTEQAKKKMPKWLKALLKLVVAVIEFILAVAG